MSRYKKIEKGIRFDTKTEKYVANKRVDSKLRSKSFKSKFDAKKWYLTVKEKKVELLNDEPDNGIKDYNFGDAFELYTKRHLDFLEVTTKETVLGRIKVWVELLDYKMVRINQVVLDEVIAKIIKNLPAKSKRQSLDNDLKALRSFFSWYNDEIDFRFISPVTKRHYKQGKIKKVAKKEKQMNKDEVQLLFDSFRDPIARNFFTVQFFCAARYGEIAGLQWSDVDFQNRTISIKHSLATSRETKLPIYLKSTKTQSIKKHSMSEVIYLILKNLYNDRASYQDLSANCDCHASNPLDFVFHTEDGAPLIYRSLQTALSYAFRKSGLNKKYSQGTHTMRHSFISITRDLTGSIDYAQAVSGHKSLKMVEHYGKLASTKNSEAVNLVDKAMNLKLKII